jgi:hypothetical protein
VGPFVRLWYMYMHMYMHAWTTGEMDKPTLSKLQLPEVCNQQTFKKHFSILTSYSYLMCAQHNQHLQCYLVISSLPVTYGTRQIETQPFLYAK